MNIQEPKMENFWSRERNLAILSIVKVFRNRFKTLQIKSPVAKAL